LFNPSPNLTHAIGRGRKEEGRRKKEEGRRKKEEGRGALRFQSSSEDFCSETGVLTPGGKLTRHPPCIPVS